MNISNSNRETIIIGSGVIGLSLAWELVRRGAKVTVMDSGAIGRGASWAGAGILPPAAKSVTNDAYEQLRSLGHQLHPNWSKRLLADTGIDNGFRRCGGIYLARTAAEFATLKGNEYWWQEHSIDFEALSTNGLVRREPELAPIAETLKGSWFLPDECQVRNPRHLQALAKACLQSGVKLIENQRVERLLVEHTVVTGLESAGQIMEASQVCICSGAWARESFQQLGLQTGIMPVRGQMVLYQGSQPPLSSVVNEGHRYLVPREDGYVLAGSVEEEVGYNCETTDAAITQISNWAENTLPLLSKFQIVRTWAGLRPGSFDALPYLGQMPGYENLFVAAGHFRSGLHLACATAVVMADAMLGKLPPIDLSPFRPGRG
ncbi:MAG: glycine oxidase ThiO [Planctomycetales bacterium]|nr:glycine oxidase ThiO [Planctomycetales bacterium]